MRWPIRPTSWPPASPSPAIRHCRSQLRPLPRSASPRAATLSGREIVSRCFAPPRSWVWIQAIAYWAQVAIAIGVPDPAWLYDRLAGHAGELAVVGSGVDCGGAVDSLLAGLAWRLGRTGEAAERARAGLALEAKIGSRVWVDRTAGLLGQIAGEEIIVS